VCKRLHRASFRRASRGDCPTVQGRSDSRPKYLGLGEKSTKLLDGPEDKNEKLFDFGKKVLG
jgi:hypothetical protein